MIRPRTILGTPSLVALLLFSALALESAATPGVPEGLLPTADAPAPVPAQTRESRAAITPADALRRLVEGNARFVAGTALPRDLRAQVQETAGGQYPFATILGCIDSRVPPEIVFDQGIGDVFSVRIAGNFVDPSILGSLEFASKVAGSKLIVVLGHTECGAIKGACDGVTLGNLTETLSHLRPAVAAVTNVPGARDSKNAAFVDAVTRMNVKLTMEAIQKRSPILDGMIARGEIDLAGAVYDVRTGRVTFLQ